MKTKDRESDTGNSIENRKEERTHEKFDQCTLIKEWPTSGHSGKLVQSCFSLFCCIKCVSMSIHIFFITYNLGNKKQIKLREIFKNGRKMFVFVSNFFKKCMRGLTTTLIQFACSRALIGTDFFCTQ